MEIKEIRDEKDIIEDFTYSDEDIEEHVVLLNERILKIARYVNNDFLEKNKVVVELKNILS
jgi:hypothetical protein